MSEVKKFYQRNEGKLGQHFANATSFCMFVGKNSRLINKIPDIRTKDEDKKVEYIIKFRERLYYERLEKWKKKPQVKLK